MKPDICPLVIHDRVICEKSNLHKGKEDFCKNEKGTSYTKCPVFSQWFWRQVIKEQRGVSIDEL